MRGFDLSVSQFKVFTDNIASNIITHVNFSRQDYGDRTMTGVAQGNDKFYAHSEMAYFPFRPDVAWFYCKHPASEGGETTLYDGLEVLKSLPCDSRELFEQNRLLFTNCIPPKVWSVIEHDRNSIEQFLDTFEPTTFSYEFDEHGNIHTRYVVSAITQTLFGDAFSNSLLDSYTPSFEDGRSIPKRALEDVIATTEELAVSIQWKAGDVLMVDNARFMHGRRAFEDKAREILVRFSNM